MQKLTFMDPIVPPHPPKKCLRNIWMVPWAKKSWSFKNKGSDLCLEKAKLCLIQCSAVVQSVWCKALRNSIWICVDRQMEPHKLKFETNITIIRSSLIWLLCLSTTFLSLYYFDMEIGLISVNSYAKQVNLKPTKKQVWSLKNLHDRLHRII